MNTYNDEKAFMHDFNSLKLTAVWKQQQTKKEPKHALLWKLYLSALCKFKQPLRLWKAYQEATISVYEKTKKGCPTKPSISLIHKGQIPQTEAFPEGLAWKVMMQSDGTSEPLEKSKYFPW